MRKLVYILAIMFFFVPVLSSAHVYLLQCVPAQDEEINTPPDTVVLTFVGSVETAFSEVEVFGPDGEKVSGETRFLENDTVMEVDMPNDLSSGVYTVKWTCMSLDGHRQKGEYKFTLK